MGGLEARAPFERPLPRPRRALGLAIRLAVAFGLLTLVFQSSFVGYLAETDPALALRLDQDHPVALARVAADLVARIEEEVAKETRPLDPASVGSVGRFATRSIAASDTAGAGQTSMPVPSLSADSQQKRLSEARRMLETSLRAAPLNHAAVSLLGRVVELQAGENEDPFVHYELAARLSRRASYAIYRLLLRDAEVGHYARAALHADILLRTVAAARQDVVPVLARLAELPAAVPHVTSLLAADPPWRATFLEVMHDHVRDARAPMTLLLALRDAGRPPAHLEIKAYLDFLMRRRLAGLAYYLWIELMPQDRRESVGFLFNGGFEWPLSGLPFDWGISAGSGVIAEAASIPGEAQGKALRIEFSDGRVELGGVSQAVLLSPGRYTLSGRYRGELIGRRGLRWRLHCVNSVGGTHVLAETAMHLGAFLAWRTFDLRFTVPESECAYQTVRLDLDARSASEQLVRGTLWYDDLKISLDP